MIGNPAYPTYQVFIAIAVAAAVTGLAMPPFIRLLKKDGIGQQIRADGPQSHLVKQGTPTMGGVIILAGVVLTVALLAKWTPDLILAVIATLATGSLGLLDDIESVAHKRSLGLTPSQKMAGLITISVVFCLAAVNWVGIDAVIRFPGGVAIDLGVLTTTLPIAGGIQIPWLYLAFVFLLMAGLSNSVNLTDGLDGLAILVLIDDTVGLNFLDLGRELELHAVVLLVGLHQVVADVGIRGTGDLRHHLHDGNLNADGGQIASHLQADDAAADDQYIIHDPSLLSKNKKPRKSARRLLRAILHGSASHCMTGSLVICSIADGLRFCQPVPKKVFSGVFSVLNRFLAKS